MLYVIGSPLSKPTLLHIKLYHQILQKKSNLI